MCEVMGNAIQTKFNQRLLEEQKKVSKAPLSELNLRADMATDEQFKRDRDLLALLEAEPVNVAAELISGMGQVLQSFVKEETDKRDLNTLVTNFL